MGLRVGLFEDFKVGWSISRIPANDMWEIRCGKCGNFKGEKTRKALFSQQKCHVKQSQRMFYLILVLL